MLLATARRSDLQAADLAELCLGQLAEDPGQLADFLGFSGYTPASLRAARGSAELAAGMIDYFAGNDALLLTLCANHGLRPEEFMGVWHRLNPAG